MKDEEIPALRRRGYKLYTVSYPDEAVGIWIAKWTSLVRKYGHCTQGENAFDLKVARRVLLAPTEESWIPIRASF